MTRSIEDIVQSNFLRFKSYEGSEHIATRSSQVNLLTILQSMQPQELLDFGAGIGTITALALDNSEANITAIEKDKWCSDQFAAHNLPNSRITLTQTIPRNRNYDICIIDDVISISEVCKIFRGGKKSFIVFIEGRRSSTVTKFSFYSIFYKYSGTYIRCQSRLDLFGNSSSEKAGSYFHFFRNSLTATILSYLKRFRKTEDLRQLNYYIKMNLRDRKI